MMGVRKQGRPRSAAMGFAQAVTAYPRGGADMCGATVGFPGARACSAGRIDELNSMLYSYMGGPYGPAI